MASRATASSTWLTWRTRNACSSSRSSILLLRPGCAPNPAPPVCVPWFILMKSSAICPPSRTHRASRSSCAFSSKRVLLELGWCLPPKTQLTWITRRFPTLAHGSSENSKPTRTNSVCWMAWQRRQALSIGLTLIKPFPPLANASSYCTTYTLKLPKSSPPDGR